MYLQSGKVFVVKFIFYLINIFIFCVLVENFLQFLNFLILNEFLFILGFFNVYRVNLFIIYFLNWVGIVLGYLGRENRRGMVFGQEVFIVGFQVLWNLVFIYFF